MRSRATAALVLAMEMGGTAIGVVDFENDHDGALVLEGGWKIGLEVLEVVEDVGAWVARTLGDGLEVVDASAGDGLSAGRLVGLVVEDEVDEVGRGLSGDGHEGAEVHEQAAVAVHAPYLLVGPGEGEAERYRGRLPHSTYDGEVIVRVVCDVLPIPAGCHGVDDYCVSTRLSGTPLCVILTTAQFTKRYILHRDAR